MKSETRKRTRVACNACRRKKIRCDGQPRCRNCILTDEAPCVYEQRQPKTGKTGGSARHHKKLLEYLSERVHRLEAAVLALNKRTGLSDDHVAPEDGLTCSSSDESDDSMEIKEELPREDNVALKPTELYFGAHSLVGIFSPSSLAWMESHLGPESSDILLPLRNMPILFQKKTRNFLLHWLDPTPMDAQAKTRILVNPFPKNQTAVFLLLETHYRPLCLTDNMKPESILSLFHAYYTRKSSSKPVFRVSTLMRMTVAFLMAIASHAEAAGKSNAPTPPAGSYFTEDEFWDLQNELLANLVAYYHRISIVGEGQESVEALLMLVYYVDKDCVVAEVSYLILTLAIKVACGLGFHRIESYAHLSEKAALERRHLWSLCRYMDMELCYRTGKVPIVNYNDISRELQGCHNFLGEAHPMLFATSQYFLAIFECRFKSYIRLFSATARLGTFAELQENLDVLNLEMAGIAMNLPENIRPVFFNDPNFKPMKEVLSQADEINLTCVLTYFTHMMLINRLPLIFSFPEVPEEFKLGYRNLSLNSARTILHIIMGLEKESFQGSYSSWAIFFPVTAILHLLATCMNSPHSAEAISDLRLLIDVTVKFFNHRTLSKKVGPFDLGRVSSLFLILIKTILKVTITILEKKLGISIIEEDSSLRDILFPTQKTFPELYSDSDSLKKNAKSAIFFNAKSPFSSDSKVIENTPSPASQCMMSCDTNNGQVISLGSSQHNQDPGLILADEQLANVMHLNNDEENFGGQFDEIDSLINSQLNQLPHFFFDT